MYIFLALLSMVLGSVQNIMGKQIANQKMDSETMFINSYLFLGIFKILIILVVVGSSFVFRPTMLLLLLPNIMLGATIQYLYLKSLKKLPISVVAPIYLINYPISMIFCIGFLGEKVTFYQVIAMIIIFIIIFMLSISSSKKKINKGINRIHHEESHKKLALHLTSISKGIVYILAAGLLAGVTIVLDKNLYNLGLTIEEMILFSGFGNVIISIIFYNINKSKLNKKGIKYSYTLTPLMLVMSGFQFLSAISYTSAMKMGNATIVVPIYTSNILLIEILSSLLLKESLKKFQYICICIFVIALFILII